MHPVFSRIRMTGALAFAGVMLAVPGAALAESAEWGCYEDVDCFGGGYCDPEWGRCVECVEDAHCAPLGEDWRCFDTTCLEYRSCTIDDECADLDEVCQVEDGFCGACNVADDCEDGLPCLTDRAGHNYCAECQPGERSCDGPFRFLECAEQGYWLVGRCVGSQTCSEDEPCDVPEPGQGPGPGGDEGGASETGAADDGGDRGGSDEDAGDEGPATNERDPQQDPNDDAQDLLGRGCGCRGTGRDGGLLWACAALLFRRRRR